MSSLPVYADAVSRLQADIAIVRLIRAGVPISRISAVFPRRRAPNSVCCWLKNFNRIPSTSWPAAAAGLLGKLLKSGINASHVAGELDELGLAPDTARRLCEKMEEDRIVLFVHARTETEAAVAWHIFHHVGCENIVLPADIHLHAAVEIPAAVPQLAGLAA